MKTTRPCPHKEIHYDCALQNYTFESKEHSGEIIIIQNEHCFTPICKACLARMLRMKSGEYIDY